MSLELSHYTWDAHLTPRSVVQPGGEMFKPHGLWVSVDGEDDWPTWRKSEGFRDTDAQNRYRVFLAEDANVLILDTVEKVREFSRTYRAINLYTLAWDRVADLYDGVIIAPYQWSLRYALDWYYGWDCASGCIWDASAIASVTLAATPVMA